MILIDTVNFTPSSDLGDAMSRLLNDPRKVKQSRRQTILAVDDNPTNLEILDEILGESYRLVTAHDAASAVEMARKCSPHYVLLDVMLPEVDGYEICQTLRLMNETARSYIIMVTAKAMPSERFQGFEVGADAYITKPFDEADLLAELRRAGSKVENCAD